MISTSICNSYKKEILDGLHQPGDRYKIALFTKEANLNKSTTRYSPKHEVPSDNDGVPSGYDEGGLELSGYFSGVSGDTGYIDWSPDPSWPYATLTARGCMIYNASKEDRAVAVYEFRDSNDIGMDVSCTNGTFTVRLPGPGSSAIVRVS